MLYPGFDPMLYQLKPYLRCYGLCVADRGVEFRWGQTKDYYIGICCFSAKHAVLRRKE